MFKNFYKLTKRDKKNKTRSRIEMARVWIVVSVRYQVSPQLIVKKK